MPASTDSSTAASRAGDFPGADDFTAAWEAFGLATRRARARLNREDDVALTASQLHLLEPLERQGALEAVERSADSDDRRCVNVALTEPGRELVLAKRTAVERRRAELFARLRPEEAEEATRLLRRLADLIDEL